MTGGTNERRKHAVYTQGSVPLQRKYSDNCSKQGTSESCRQWLVKDMH